MYDELLRKRLADRCQKNAPGCDPDSDTHVVDDTLLKQAVKVYNERGEHYKGGKTKGGKGDSKGSTKGAQKGGASWSHGWGNTGESWGRHDGKGEKRTLPWQSDHYSKKPKGSSKGGHHLSYICLYSGMCPSL